MQNIKNIKKQIIKGTEEYINKSTGEVEKFTVISKDVNSDYNFHKVWLSELIKILDLSGGKKLKIISYILDNIINENNLFSATQSEIAKDINVSKRTVGRTINMLIEANFISKVRPSTYMINPNILVKGRSNKRMNLLIKFRDVSIKNSKKNLKDNSENLDSKLNKLIKERS